MADDKEITALIKRRCPCSRASRCGARAITRPTAPTWRSRQFRTLGPTPTGSAAHVPRGTQIGFSFPRTAKPANAFYVNLVALFGLGASSPFGGPSRPVTCNKPSRLWQRSGSRRPLPATGWLGPPISPRFCVVEVRTRRQVVGQCELRDPYHPESLTRRRKDLIHGRECLLGPSEPARVATSRSSSYLADEVPGARLILLSRSEPGTLTPPQSGRLFVRRPNERLPGCRRSSTHD